jgi:broad-specificity NMP kinase
MDFRFNIKRKKCVIISGFAGIGKTKIKEHVPNFEHVNIYDLSSSYFRKDADWEKVYCDIVEALAEKYDYVFISAHQVVISEMISRGIPFYIVYPRRHCRDEYRERFKLRGDSEDYINKFMKRWDTFIDLLDNVDYDRKITLRTGQYLSDVIGRMR